MISPGTSRWTTSSAAPGNSLAAAEEVAVVVPDFGLADLLGGGIAWDSLREYPRDSALSTPSWHVRCGAAWDGRGAYALSQTIGDAGHAATYAPRLLFSHGVKTALRPSFLSGHCGLQGKRNGLGGCRACTIRYKGSVRVTMGRSAVPSIATPPKRGSCGNASSKPWSKHRK